MPQSAWTLRTRTPCDRQQWSIRRCGDRISSAERRPAAQVEVDQALPSARRGSLGGWCPEGLQPIDVLLLSSSASRVAWAISLALCRSKSISDRVNIRGPGEIPSFRLSKAVEGVTELGPPPLLEVPSVLFSELMQLLLGGGSKWPSRACRSTHHADGRSTRSFEPAAHGHSAPLADEVVHQDVLASANDVAFESRLTGKAAVTVGACVGHHIRLHDVRVCVPSNSDREY